jgi:hypothetical protein
MKPLIGLIALIALAIRFSLLVKDDAPVRQTIYGSQPTTEGTIREEKESCHSTPMTGGYGIVIPGPEVCSKN